MFNMTLKSQINEIKKMKYKGIKQNLKIYK